MIIKPPAMAHPFLIAALPNTGPDDPYGCVMNVVSWMAGDTDITAEPDCVNHHLINICQTFNDELLERFGTPEREYPELVRLVGAATPQQAIRILEIAALVKDTRAVTKGESREWLVRTVARVHPGSITGGYGMARHIAQESDTFDEAVDRFLDIIHDFRSTFAEKLGINHLEETRV
ncbi:hypothetical protein SEA_CULVER_91 [Gordonia phage Culver]|nr:hypothetical protein SEA_CULVER_91 [Gordonia phage Culver]